MSLSEKEKIRANLISLFELCSETVDWLLSLKVKLSIDSLTLRAATLALKTMSPETFLPELINRSYPFWADIHSRKEEFLLENIKVIFSELPEKYRDDMSHIFTIKGEDGKYLINSDIRNDFWDILNGTLKCILRYIDNGRCPRHDGKSKVYTKEFYPSLKIKEMLSLLELQ